MQRWEPSPGAPGYADSVVQEAEEERVEKGRIQQQDQKASGAEEEGQGWGVGNQERAEFHQLIEEMSSRRNK